VWRPLPGKRPPPEKKMDKKSQHQKLKGSGRATSRDPIRDLLGRLKNVRQTGPEQWTALCPAHDDERASLSIKLNSNRILLHCHAGCRPEAIVNALGLELRDLFLDKSEKKRTLKPKEKIWRIRDLDGNLVAEHVRLDGPYGKRLWWRRNGKKGLGGLSTKQLPLYGTELLHDLPDGSVVVVTEGEKAADAVRNVGITAVGTVTGAATIPERKVLEPLARFNVVLWPDNDPQGKDHMERIAEELMALGVKPRWVEWSDAPPKGDAADADPQRIRELVKIAKEWKPPGKLDYIELLDLFRKWLYLPDDLCLRFLLSLVIANRLPGDPLWGMLIGSSGSLKTELLNSITGLPNVQTLDVLTPNTFLSGKQRKDPTASLLKRLPDGSVLVMRDFTTVLALRRDQRAEILAQLRKIYDGHFTKATGEGSESSILSWQGKLGLICGCTPVIEQVRTFAAQLGERFLYFHLPTEFRERSAVKALSNREALQTMRAELQEAVRRFFVGLNMPSHVEIPDQITRFIVDIADFVAYSRSTVPRDPYSREVIELPSPEMPTRLAQQLGALAAGHAVLEGRDYVCKRDLSLVATTALHCIPKGRRALLEHLSTADGPETTAEIATALDLPTTTTRRYLEDLALLKLARRQSQGPGKADLWEITTYARDRWVQLSGNARKAVHKHKKDTFPEMSRSVCNGVREDDGQRLCLSGDFSGTPTKVLSQTEKQAFPDFQEAPPDDPVHWPTCEGCKRKVREVDARGLCPDCAAVEEAMRHGWV